MKHITSLAIAILLGLTSGGLLAAEPSATYGPEINLAMAKKVATAALAECQRNKWNVAIAVVDNHGFLVYYEKLDDTQFASPVIAIEKARTAAMFRRLSGAMEEAVNKGRTSMLGLPLATPITGGVPIRVDGKIIGAVGASGVLSEQDEQCAKAGVAALTPA
jgi:uncharacterized protein GlcG (DUF336 family)